MGERRGGRGFKHPFCIMYFYHLFICNAPGRLSQLVGHLTRKSKVLGSIPGLATYFRFSFPLIQEGQLSVTGKILFNSFGGLIINLKEFLQEQKLHSK